MGMLRPPYEGGTGGAGRVPLQPLAHQVALSSCPPTQQGAVSFMALSVALTAATIPMPRGHTKTQPLLLSHVSLVLIVKLVGGKFVF